MTESEDQRVNRAAGDDAVLDAVLPDADVVCLLCGYNLRGLEPDGHCPECGASIATSVTSENARHAAARHEGAARYVVALDVAPLAWLRRAALGCRYCMAAVLLYSALGLPAGALLWLRWVNDVRFGGKTRLVETAVVLLLIVAAVAWCSLLSIGVWLLTTPESTRRNLTRVLARWGTVLVCWAWLPLLGWGATQAPSEQVAVLLGLAVPFSPLSTVGYCALAAYLGWLGERARDAGARARGYVLAVCYGVVWGLCLMALLQPSELMLLAFALPPAAALITFGLPYRLRPHLRAAHARMLQAALS